jgi:hypothetical protein
VPDAAVSHVDQLPVVGLERDAHVEHRGAIGAHQDPVAAGRRMDRPAQALALEHAAGDRGDAAVAGRGGAEVDDPGDVGGEGEEVAGLDHASCSVGLSDFICDRCPSLRARAASGPLHCAVRRENNGGRMTRLYSLTEAGRKVWDTRNNRVPLDCRRVLGLIKPETDPRDLRARLGWSEDAVDEVLKELERGGLVKSIGMSASPDAPDLDFTDSLKIADIQAAQRARDQK